MVRKIQHKVSYSDFKKMYTGPKRNWFARHPLASGIMGAALIGGAVLLANKCNAKDASKKEERGAVSQTNPMNREQERSKRMRAQVAKIKQVVEFQKRLVESGWYEQREMENEELREELKGSEEEFLLEIEGKTKEQLVELLISQNRVIEHFREYYEGTDDPEFVHEQNKGKMLQRKLDEVEIAERGLLEKSVEELEALLIELDDILIREHEYSVENYIEAMEERTLIARAIEERQFWDSVWSPRG